jgi:NAD(P)-dependent dehydrogenase (short-subunit alcohol dehydrogenase family)
MRDRTVIVTGGGSGIGRAAVLLAAERGARVASLDVDGESAERSANEALERGAAAAIGIRCDVTVEAEVEAAVSRTVAEFGGPYGLFANAGTDKAGLVHELTRDDWEDLLSVNLTGAYLTCKHALRPMIEGRQGGSIVCTSSPAAFVAFAAGGTSAYAASKGGISALVRAMAIDYAEFGIRVNAIVPGPTHTKLMWVNVPEDERPAMQEVINSEVPLGRMADPEEIARCAVWLISDDSSYVTGSHLVCDGGVLAKGSISV